MRPSPARAVPYDPAAWLPVPDPSALPAIEELSLDAHVSLSPARAEPHDPDAWLPLPVDLDALPPVEMLLAPSPELQSTAVDEAETIVRDAAAAAEAAVAPSPARAEPHDPATWLPVPDPDRLATLPELEVGAVLAARPQPRRRALRVACAFGAVIALVAVGAGAVLLLRSETPAPPVAANTFPVSVDLDGVVKTVNTSASNPEALMHQLHVGKLVALRTEVPRPLRAGSSVVLRTRHNGLLVVDGQTVRFDSASRTVAELLTAYHVLLFGDDYVQPDPDSVLADGGTVEVFRVGGETRQETETIPFGEVQQSDPNTALGQTSELQAGAEGLATITYRDRIENGHVVGTTLLSRVTTIEPKPHIIGIGAAYDPTWDLIATCESNQRWGTVDPATPAYDGGLGIYRGTWLAFGGGEFAPNAGLASKTQQIIVAERIRAAHGFTAWGCGQFYGLP
ncbi:MAG TPA: transglycosylase family protein [Acidimicrobiia bacterium]